MKREFADQYATLEKWHWWFRGRRQILEVILSRELSGREPLKLASLGCGPAEGLSWLEPFVGRGGQLVGCDLNASYAKPIAPGIHYVLGNLEAAPFASGTFDVVLALDIVEHLDDDVAGVREAARLLKPGGLLVVTVPAMPSLWGRQDVVSHHRRRYTKSTLYNTFRKAGLSGPRLTYFNTLLFLPIAAIRWTRAILDSSDFPGSDFDDNHPGRVNDLLAAVFSAERHFVGRMPMPFGASLLGTFRLG